MKDEWEVADLKHGKCRLTISIHKESRYRNTYCVSCGHAHMWKRIDQKEFNKRINK
jgi:Zn ribbon nucleic-acid-binding protein